MALTHPGTTETRVLFEQLDAPDPLVRMVAAASLRERTGQDAGYHHADPRPERLEAIERWVDMVNSSESS